MPLLLVQWPELPTVALLALIAAVLGVGEVAQRVENTKTRRALQETPPATPQGDVNWG
ncbi:hypothetical protein [Streptomyces sp. NPDC051561]|uniref:hypothetical protein n=1 Tax=Streptomyces sp. NPDC051561 TaxID=3365658 RepID=UPI00379D4072